MRKAPGYLKHSSGQAFCRIAGHNHYLGKHGTPESQRAYDQLISQFLANGRTLPTKAAERTVAAVILAYLYWAKNTYVKDGKSTGQDERCRLACRAPGELYAEIPASSFGVAEMEATLKQMTTYGWTRGYINTCFSVLKSMWRWAGLRDFITMEQALKLCQVKGLKKGRTSVPESRKILAVDAVTVEKTLPFMSSVIRAMVQTQLLTGMRPAEVCRLRAIDIDRSSEPWTYRPHTHKLEHMDEDRVIYLGPKARAVLAPWIARRVLEQDDGGYLFRPADSIDEAAEKHARPWMAKNKTHLLNYYTTKSYRHAISVACQRGNVEHWYPLQVRHRRATDVRKSHGLDAARGLLGHTDVSTTQVYAELDEDVQRRLAEDEG